MKVIPFAVFSKLNQLLGERVWVESSLPEDVNIYYVGTLERIDLMSQGIITLKLIGVKSTDIIHKKSKSFNDKYFYYKDIKTIEILK